MAPTLLKGIGWVALWSLVGLAIASEVYLSSNFLGRSITWGEAVSDSLEDWYVYGALSLPVVWLARRYPPELGSRWAAAGIHLAAALAFSLAYVLLRTLVGEVDSRSRASPPPSRRYSTLSSSGLPLQPAGLRRNPLDEPRARLLQEVP
jgi:hypothetical protein